MKLGWQFGRTPMGFHQVLAFRRRRIRCCCDPRFAGIAHDVACPIHGLAATLRLAVRNLRDDERLAA